MDACDEALLLLEVRGIYKIYNYDCARHIVESAPPFEVVGNSTIKHLAGCEKGRFNAAQALQRSRPLI